MKNLIIIILLGISPFVVKAQTLRPIQLLMDRLNISQEDAIFLLSATNETVSKVKNSIIEVAKYNPTVNKNELMKNIAPFFDKDATIAFSYSYKSDVTKTLYWYNYFLRLSKYSRKKGNYKRDIVIRFSKQDTLREVTKMSSYTDRDGNIHTDNVADILFKTVQLYIAYTTYDGSILTNTEIEDIRIIANNDAIKKKYTKIDYLDITEKSLQCVVYKENGIWQCVVKHITAENAIKIDDFEKLLEVEVY